MKTSFKGCALLLGVATMFDATRAFADVKYTENMTMAGGAAKSNAKTPAFSMQFSSTTTTYLKEGLKRVETTTKMFGESKEIEIASCAKRQRAVLDPQLKIYYVESLFENARLAPKAASSTRSSPKAAPAPPQSDGKIVLTPTVKFLGREKIGSRSTRHYSFSMRMQTSGCMGKSDITMKMEHWMADVALPSFRCENPHEKWTRYASRDGSRPRCVPTFEIKGNLAKYSAATKGLALKTVMRDAKTGKAMMTTQITMISFAKLNDSNFAIPSGYEKLTREAYDQTRQKAMQDAMMQGMMSRSRTSNPDAQNDDAQSDEEEAADAVRNRLLDQFD